MRITALFGVAALFAVASCGSADDEEEIGSSSSALACGQRCRHHFDKRHCHRDCIRDCRCPAPYSDCDGLRRNGCETDTSTDVANCGACGDACPVPAHASRATCAGGACGFVCEPGFADCDGDASNGCEIDTVSDPVHCGSCTAACAAPANGTSACTNSTCSITCNPGWSDCDGDSANGCETDTTSDLGHCGSCAACPNPANATLTCANSTCVVVACASGWKDCDRQGANGCEVDATSDPLNCGGCGLPCVGAPGTTATCTSGQCSFTCGAGYQDCDALSSNGCESAGPCPSRPTITCTTTVRNNYTGAIIQQTTQSDVPIQQGPWTSSLMLLSDGVRSATGSYPVLFTGNPSGIWIEYYGNLLSCFAGGPPSPCSIVVIHVTRVGDSATLWSFNYSTRPFETQIYTVTCTTGTTTVLPP